MTDNDKHALISCLLWAAAMALMFEILAPYWASDRVERAQERYIAEKIESYEDEEILKALRVLRWLQRQGGGNELER